MEKIDKPWIAFKVLAAGAVHPKKSFRYAFENGADFVVRCNMRLLLMLVVLASTASVYGAEVKSPIPASMVQISRAVLYPHSNKLSQAKEKAHALFNEM